MVRIKGANSDYTYVGEPRDAPIQENKAVSPLFMEIFVCPNDMPSRVEAPHNGKWCEGTDQTCPHDGTGKKTGHAKIRLEQNKGIILSSKDKNALQVSDQAVTTTVPLQVQQSLTVTIKIPGKQDVRLEVSPSGIAMQAAGGATVKLTDKGIELSPGPGGTVKMTGTVDLSGASVTLPAATVQALVQEILPKLKS